MSRPAMHGQRSRLGLGLAFLASLGSLALGQDDLKEGKRLLLAGDYEKAFPLLAKSEDKLLAPLAEIELSAPKEYMAVAAQYKDAVKKAPAALKLPLLDRMVHWYGKQWNSIIDPKEKAELRKVFNQIEPIPPGYDKPSKKAPLVPGWGLGEVDSTIARSGQRSMKILPLTEAERATKREAYTETTMFPVVGNKTYVFSAWVFTTDTDQDAKMQARIYGRDNSPNALVVKDVRINMDNPFWQKVSITIDAPEDGFRAMMYFNNPATKGAVWIDDVTVTVNGTDIFKNGGFEGK